MDEAALKARIAELEETVSELEKDLIHDSLTGLKTRAYFCEEAKIHFDVVSQIGSDSGSRRKKWFGFKELSFIFIDIDHFKSINDTYGHFVGDEVLKAVAETIRISVRTGDTAARWGGEEIAVSLVGASERDAAAKAEDIRRQIESIRFGKYPDLHVTVSAGVSTAHQGSTFEETIERADRALYKAKQTGRNKIVAYSSIS